MRDYTPITELPGSLLSADQLRRFAQRYALAAQAATGKRVVEVACGAGGGLTLLATQAAWVIGVDYTPTVLEQARRAVAVPLLRADAQALPLAPACCDLLLCFEAIYYLADYRRFLAESRRVLAPGGRLLLCESNPDWHAFVPGDLTTRYPGAPELANALRAAGLRDVQLLGALPAPPGRGRAAWAAQLRRLLLRYPNMAAAVRRAPLLKRLGYGTLYALPAALDATTAATWSAGMTLTPLDPARPDRTHRVLFAWATA